MPVIPATQEAEAGELPETLGGGGGGGCGEPDHTIALHLSGSSDSSVLASRVAVITGTHHHTWLVFVFLVEMGFHHVGQAGLEFLTSGHLSASSPGVLGLQV